MLYCLYVCTTNTIRLYKRLYSDIDVCSIKCILSVCAQSPCSVFVDNGLCWPRLFLFMIHRAAATPRQHVLSGHFGSSSGQVQTTEDRQPWRTVVSQADHACGQRPRWCPHRTTMLPVNSATNLRLVFVWGLAGPPPRSDKVESTSAGLVCFKKYPCASGILSTLYERGGGRAAKNKTSLKIVARWIDFQVPTRPRLVCACAKFCAHG